MSTPVYGDQELFSLGEKVWLNKPGKRFPQNLRGYIKAFGKGPFLAIQISGAEGNPVHPQIVKIGQENGETIMVSFGGNTPEPAEISGFWLTHQAW